MQAPLLVHIAAGGVGIVTGYVALFAAKGAGLHRRSGILFVFAMVTMATSGAVIGAFKGQLGNVIAGLLTAYMVITALTTLRPPNAGSRRLAAGLMLVGLAVGVASMGRALDSLSRGESTRNGVPVAMLVIFGTIALAASLSDVRMLRPGGITGARRLRRHLWRMCFALFIATGSFFLGQADEFPESLRIFPLLAIPAFLPLVVMPYWLCRVRARRAPRETARVPEAALVQAG
jgi:uncharacterized membrane protein